MKKILILFFILACQGAYSYACTHSKQLRAVYNHQQIVIKGCKDIEAIYTLIGDAIDVGAPIYNEGRPLGCYKIYEGTAYKIIYLYGNKCKDVKNVLQTALKKCNDYYSASEKAWVMRRAFDQILGVPTITN